MTRTTLKLTIFKDSRGNMFRQAAVYMHDRTMYVRNPDQTETDISPINRTVQLIGGKYKPSILWLISEQPRRFSELEAILTDATPRMLSKHLRELEEDGLVIRTVVQESPLKVEYSLTTTGMSLIPVLEAMTEWGAAYQDMEREKGVNPSRSPR